MASRPPQVPQLSARKNLHHAKIRKRFLRSLFDKKKDLYLTRRLHREVPTLCDRGCRECHGLTCGKDEGLHHGGHDHCEGLHHSYYDHRAEIRRMSSTSSHLQRKRQKTTARRQRTRSVAKQLQRHAAAVRRRQLRWASARGGILGLARGKFAAIGICWVAIFNSQCTAPNCRLDS